MSKFLCILVLLMALTGCGKKQAAAVTVPAENAAPTETTASVSEISETAAPETMIPRMTVSEIQGRTAGDHANMPKNTCVFMGGPRFTGMTVLANRNFPDGTYHYEDMTEDSFSRIVNRSFANGEKTEDVDTRITRLLTEECGEDTREIRIQEAPDKSDGLIPNECRLVRWICAHEEDTKECVGIAAVTKDFTYLYYCCTYGDYFDSMESTWLDRLDEIKLVDLDSPQ